MGCASSSVKYRDVYEEMLKLWSFEPSKYGSTPSANSVAERSRLFESLSISGRNASSSSSSDLIISKQRKHQCDPLLAEQHDFLRSISENARVTRVHSYNVFLAKRMPVVMGEERLNVSKGTGLPVGRAEEVFARWNFRVCLMGMCEFFHVLAVCEEKRVFPKKFKSWISQVNKQLGFLRGVGGPGWTEKALEDEKMKALIQEGLSITITSSDLTKKFVGQLQKEMPAVLVQGGKSCVGGPATSKQPDSTATVKELFSSAAGHWKRQQHHWNAENPLQTSRVASDGIPFLIFVEWLAVHYTLSFCGEEEDPSAYGVVNLNFPASVLRNPNELLQAWREKLQRLEKVEELLQSSEIDLPSVERERLTEEAEAIGRELQTLWDQLTNGATTMDSEAMDEAVYNMFRLDKSLPDRDTHTMLSLKAFISATDAERTEEIASTQGLRRYLKAYLVLHDIYRDAVVHMLENSNVDLSVESACQPQLWGRDTFMAALTAASARGDLDLDYLVQNGWPDCGPTYKDPLMQLLLDLFNNGELTGANYFNRGDNDYVLGQSGQLPESIMALLRSIFPSDGADFPLFDDDTIAEIFALAADLFARSDYGRRAVLLAVQYAVLHPANWPEFNSKAHLTSSSKPLLHLLWEVRTELSKRESPAERRMNINRLMASLFCAVAGFCAFEEVMPKEVVAAVSEPGGKIAKLPNSFSGDAGGRRRDLDIFAHISHSWFSEGVQHTTSFVGCSPQTLFADAALFLDVIAEKPAARDVDSVAVVNSTFSLLRLLAEKEAANLRMESVGSETASANMDHVLFLFLSNYTRLYETLERVLLAAASGDRANQNAGLDEHWGDHLMQLYMAMPLRSLQECYREFLFLSQPMLPTISDAGPREPQTFYSAFYHRYAPHFLALGFSEEAVVVMAQRATECVLQRVRANCLPGRKLASEGHLIRDCYNAFLQCILGYTMVKKGYESVAHVSLAAIDASPNGGESEVLVSEKEMGRLLATFDRLTDSKFKVPTVAEASLAIQSDYPNDGYEEFFLVQNIESWYGGHRAACYGLFSLFDWWLREIACHVPYTISAEHRQERLSVVREVLRKKQHREDVEEDVEVELVRGEDGYLPVSMLVPIMNRRWNLGFASEKVFGVQDPLSSSATATAGSGGSGAAAASPIPDEGKETMTTAVNPWMETCVEWVNKIVNRSDLEDLEIHHSDLRFLTQYAHHFITVYIGLMSTVKVLEVAVSVSGQTELDSFSISAERRKDGFLSLFLAEVVELMHPAELPPLLIKMIQEVVTEAWAEVEKDGKVTEKTHHYVAHTVTGLLVKHAHQLSLQARQTYLDSLGDYRKPQDFLNGWPSGGKMYSSEYWRRLRYVLSFGLSLQQRKRRGELYEWMDFRDRGYLTLADLTMGLMNTVHLETYRADFTPALLRAFVATKDVAATHQEVIYITEHSAEQVLLPWELKTFLGYLYRYLELYYMFDVLTCSGHVPREMGYVPKEVQTTDAEAVATPTPDVPLNEKKGKAAAIAAAAAASQEREASTALIEAANEPYQLMLKAAGVEKEVSLDQLRGCRILLRRWGANVRDMDSLFQYVNRRSSDGSAMYFTAFAIWASERGLQPEGYGHGHDEASDSIAQIEESYSTYGLD